MAMSDACTQDHSERAVDDDDDQVVLGRHSGLREEIFNGLVYCLRCRDCSVAYVFCTSR